MKSRETRCHNETNEHVWKSKMMKKRKGRRMCLDTFMSEFKLEQLQGITKRGLRKDGSGGWC